MGCGCRKGKNSQNSPSRYAFLTPAQIEDKKRLEEEERRKVEIKQGRQEGK
jgi:hypothetical protein